MKKQSANTSITAPWSIRGSDQKAGTGIQITKVENALIDQTVLETFISGKYHWRSLIASDQHKMARELYAYRAFFRALNNE